MHMSERQQKDTQRKESHIASIGGMGMKILKKMLEKMDRACVGDIVVKDCKEYELIKTTGNHFSLCSAEDFCWKTLEQTTRQTKQAVHTLILCLHKKQQPAERAIRSKA